MLVDMHTHSTYSDGTYTPQEIASLAEDIGLKAVAITDHNTTKGWNNFYNTQTKNNLVKLYGIEFSVDYKEQEVHLLGYFINPMKNNVALIKTQKQIEEFLEIENRKKIQNNYDIIKNLNKYGINISIEEVHAEKKDKLSIINRVTIANAMIHKGYVNSVEEAFQKYIGETAPCFINHQRMDIATVSSFITEIGGFSSLAHPIQYGFKVNDIKECIEYAHLNSVEALYSSFTSSPRISFILFLIFE